MYTVENSNAVYTCSVYTLTDSPLLLNLAFKLFNSTQLNLIESSQLSSWEWDMSWAEVNLSQLLHLSDWANTNRGYEIVRLDSGVERGEYKHT